MSAVMTGETFILSDRVYDVRVSPADDLRAAAVTVTLDGRFEWSLTVPGWRGVSLGASGETGYLWSAREVIVLPRAADAELQVIRVDEDLLSAFRVDDGWLVICETSVRRLVGVVETARVELGDVVEVARWEGGVLLVRDAGGEDLALRVDGEHLIV
ncbi:hypothetical protein [Mariniluteicoccus flavus]